MVGVSAKNVCQPNKLSALRSGSVRLSFCNGRVPRYTSSQMTEAASKGHSVGPSDHYCARHISSLRRQLLPITEETMGWGSIDIAMICN